MGWEFRAALRQLILLEADITPSWRSPSTISSRERPNLSPSLPYTDLSSLMTFHPPAPPSVTTPHPSPGYAFIHVAFQSFRRVHSWSAGSFRACQQSYPWLLEARSPPIALKLPQETYRNHGQQLATASPQLFLRLQPQEASCA